VEVTALREWSVSCDGRIAPVGRNLRPLDWRRFRVWRRSQVGNFSASAEMEPRFPGRSALSWSLIKERAAPLYDTSTSHAAAWALCICRRDNQRYLQASAHPQLSVPIGLNDQRLMHDVRDVEAALRRRLKKALLSFETAGSFC